MHILEAAVAVNAMLAPVQPRQSTTPTYFDRIALTQLAVALGAIAVLAGFLNGISSSAPAQTAEAIDVALR